MSEFEYGFETEDLTGPLIASVVSIALNTVRVTFDDDMLSGSDAADGDATNPASYALVLATTDQTRLPAVRGQDIVVVSATEQDSRTFDLLLDMETTPRATYELSTVARDTDQNIGTDTKAFVAYQPFVDDAREYDYLRWVPAFNLGRDEGELRNLLLCMQEVGELLLYEADAFPNVLDPDTAPEAFVDAMLSDLGNPFGFTLSTIDKRRLAQTLRRMYGQKGTDVGIINAIRFFLGIEVTIERVRASGAHLGVDSTLGQEFTLASGALADFYTFIVHVSQTIDDETEARIDEIVAFMRRAPCHWRIEAPSMIDDPDHWQLGFSRLGVTTELHE